MKISIAMATFNGSKFIEKQLESILNQTIPADEIVICDDCSSDSTLLIIEELSKKYKSIKVIRNDSNLGYIKNFEKAISLCNGDFIVLSDQDDVWRKDKIECLIDNLGTNSLVHSDAHLVDSHGEIITDSLSAYTHRINKPSLQDLLIGPHITGCTVLFRRSLLDGIVSFPPNMPHDYFLSLLASIHGISYTPEKLVDYRQHGNNAIGIQTKKRKKKKNNLVLHPVSMFLKEFLLLFERHRRNNIRYRKRYFSIKNLLVQNGFAWPHDKTQDYEEYLKLGSRKAFFDFTYYRYYRRYFKFLLNKTFFDYLRYLLIWIRH